LEGLAVVVFLIVALFIFLAVGVPVAFSLGLTSIVGMLLFLSPVHLFQIAQISFTKGTEFLFIVAPLFILMANVISFAGVGHDVFTAAQLWLGRLPGGLAVSTIIASAGFASVSGSSPATAATIGAVAMPEMLRRGYNKRLAAGSIAAGGTLGILIPPSIALIMYGIITETSIGLLFIAGIFPGLCLAAFLSIFIMIVTKAKPSLAPKVETADWRKRLVSLWRVWPTMILSVTVLGSIYGGVATPTEAAGIGAFGAMVIALAYRKLTWNNLRDSLLATVRVTSMILFLIFGGVCFAFVLSSLGIPHRLAEFIVGLEVNRWVIMLLINALFIMMGCVMDPLGILIITLPVLFPIITKLGFDPIWFGIIVTINSEIGMITPPVGFNLFVLKGVVPKEVSLGDIIRGAFPFVGILILGLLTLMLFPQLALWLPAQLK